jgi:hypothetical protein
MSMFVPPYYNLRSLTVRSASTLLTVLGIAATVATVAGVLALQQGFASLYASSGREDIAVILRQGSLSEGLSTFRREGAQKIVKSHPEFEVDESGQPLASLECYLAVRRFRVDGGETNVALRGVQPATFAIRGDEIRITAAAGQPGALYLLLQAGAEVNAREAETGNTALMLAANRARLEEVRLLLQAGADVNLKAKDGWTALAAAEMIGDSEIADLLRAAGARR